jgi:hypothetical protein
MTQYPRLGGIWWLFNPPGTQFEWLERKAPFTLPPLSRRLYQVLSLFSVFSYSFSSSVSDNSHLSPFLFYPLIFAFLLFPYCVSFPGEKSMGRRQEESVELNNHFSLTPLWREPYADEFS